MSDDAAREPGWPRPAAVLPGAGALLATLAVVATAWWRFPPPWPAAPVWSPLDGSKLLAVTRTCLALAVVNLAGLGLAWPWRRLCATPGGPALGRILRLTLGLFTLAHVVLALGLAGALTPRALGLVALAAGLAGLPAALACARRARCPRGRPPAAALLAAAGLALPLLSAFIPVYGWDALTYHLALPERFLRAGQVSVDPFSVFTTFPLLTQMLYTLALALDGPALAKLLHVELAALLVAALVALASRAGRAAALFVVLALLADPLFVFETGVVYADLPLALAALLAAHAVLEWDGSGRPAAAARTALLCGICAGVRYQGALVGPALAVALVLAGRQTPRRRLAAGAALVAGTLALLAPWLLRNLLATGSPLALSAFDPVFLRQMEAFQRGMGMGRGLVELLLAPWNLTLGSAPGLYAGGFGFRVGPLHLVALALALAGLRRSAEARLAVATASLLFLAWFFSSQEARFLLPALVLLLLAGAWGLAGVCAAAPRALRLALLAACCAGALPAQLETWQRDYRFAWRAALGDLPWPAIAQLTPVERLGELLRGGDATGVRVLCLMESRSWHLRGVDSIPYHVDQGSPALLAFHRARVAGRLCRWLEEQRVTHLVFNARTGAPVFVPGYSREDYLDDLAALDAFLASSAVELAGEQETWLFRVAPPGQCREPGDEGGGPRAARVR